jgi:hypothetical protein
LKHADSITTAIGAILALAAALFGEKFRFAGQRVPSWQGRIWFLGGAICLFYLATHFYLKGL